jgi:hypothetical protein
MLGQTVRRTWLAAGAFQVPAVLLGYLVGSVDREPRSTTSFCLLMAAVGVLLILAGRFVPSGTESRSRGRFGWVVLAYAIVVMWVDPFSDAVNTGGLLIAAGCVFPLLIAVAVLLRAGEWVTAAGVVVFTVACVALLTWNAKYAGASQASFFWYALS